MPAKNLYIKDELYSRYVLVAAKRNVKLQVVLNEALENSVEQLEARANVFKEA